MTPVFIGFAHVGGKLTLDFPLQVTAWVKHLAADSGEEVEIEIRRRRQKRSDAQNRALHAMLTPWSREEGLDITDLKRDLMGHVFGWKEVASPVTGKIMLVPERPHTSHLNVQDFCHLIDRALEIAAECGVILQAPDEYRQAKEKAAKQAAKKATAA